MNVEVGGEEKEIIIYIYTLNITYLHKTDYPLKVL